MGEGKQSPTLVAAAVASVTQTTTPATILIVLKSSLASLNE
jgi:hypothetical protein